MGFIKIARGDILDVRHSSAALALEELDLNSFKKLAKPTPEITDDGFLYVQVRAISSRVNKNHDGWPSEELAKSYKSFEGRPIFVDHNNDDPERTRGVVVWSKLHVDDEKISALDPYYSTAPDNHKPPTWVELLLEVDAESFPKLADSIIRGDIDSVSMGANIERSVCSVCANEAKNPNDYCEHVQNKGIEFEIVSSEGAKIKKKAYEDCHDITFFEISFVFDPADETALITAKTADFEDEHLSPNLADPHAEPACPDCGGKLVAGIDDPTAQQCVGCGQHWWPQDFAPWGTDLNSPSEDLNGRTYSKTAKHTADRVHHDLINRGGQMEQTLDSGGRRDPNERQLNHVPQSEMTTAPQKVDTLRSDQICPQCGSELQEAQEGIASCPECGYDQPPKNFDNPDLDLAQNMDLQNQNAEAPAANPDPAEQSGDDVPMPQTKSPVNSVPPVSPVASTTKRNIAGSVISDMNWTVKARAFVEGSASEEFFTAEKTAAPKKPIQNTKKKGTDEPTDQKIVADQLAPVEANMDKNADREVIKRVEEDGSGVKRTEEITKEFGPLGEDSSEEEETPEETDESEDEESTDDGWDNSSEDENTDTASDPFASAPSITEDKKKDDPTTKLMAALRLAKAASEMGVISSDEELDYAAKLEEETMVEIAARAAMLKQVKEAGLSKAKARPSLAHRFPSLKTASVGASDDDNTPDEAIFM